LIKPFKSWSSSSDDSIVEAGAIPEMGDNGIPRLWRRRIRLASLCSTLASAAILNLALSTNALAATTGNGATLLEASEAATAHEQSVHVVSSQSGPNVSAKAKANATVRIVTDAGRSEGIQRVTFEQGRSSGHETVEVVGGQAYLNGDSFTLENFNGFSAGAATQYAGRWLQISPSESAYASLTSAVTMSTIPAQIALPAPELLKGKSNVSGLRVQGIRGVVSTHEGTETGILYVRSGNSPLPVELISSLVKGGRGSNVFSNWNETVAVKAPANSTPFSSTGQ
jgi:hypothetical protein